MATAAWIAGNGDWASCRRLRGPDVKLLEVEDEANAASTLIDLRDKIARSGLCRRNHSVVEDDL